jgi:hypothetical protein
MYPMMRIPINTEPSKCPECGKIEDIKKICRHCGYEYKDTKLTTTESIFIILTIIFGSYMLITLLYWTMESCTLLEILKAQGNWFLELSKRIY